MIIDTHCHIYDSEMEDADGIIRQAAENDIQLILNGTDPQSNIEVLKATYGIQAENLHAIIGPGIGPESFEVGDEVYDLFAQAGFPMETLAKRYPDSRNPQAEKWHINLWECNRLQLIEKGVNPENIHVSGIDTYTNYDRFFSARRHFDGRIINGIMQKAH